METLTNVDENTNNMLQDTNCNPSIIVYIISDTKIYIDNFNFDIDTVYNWSSETQKHLLNIKKFNAKPRVSSLVEYFKQFKKSKSQ